MFFRSSWICVTLHRCAAELSAEHDATQTQRGRSVGRRATANLIVHLQKFTVMCYPSHHILFTHVWETKWPLWCIKCYSRVECEHKFDLKHIISESGSLSTFLKNLEQSTIRFVLTVDFLLLWCWQNVIWVCWCRRGLQSWKAKWEVNVALNVSTWSSNNKPCHVGNHQCHHFKKKLWHKGGQCGFFIWKKKINSDTTGCCFQPKVFFCWIF